MKTIYHFLALLLTVLVTTSANAAPVDPDAAQARVQQFLLSQSGGRLMSGGANLTLTHTQKSKSHANAADYYVFNATGGGFVIAAGDDRVNAVLGYGEGTLDMNNLPEGLQWLLGEYSRQMDYLRSHPDAVPTLTEGEGEGEGDDITVEPLLTCVWNQNAPFWDQCPLQDGARCYVGCVATAMAQVMYYWKFPSELPALDGYVTETNNISVGMLPPQTINWDNMIDEYRRNSYTEEQANEVAKLSRFCGQICHMDYTSDGSSACYDEQMMGLKALGYNPKATLYNRDDFGRGQWDQMLHEDLLAGRPVLYFGLSEESGHAFVLDGCKNGQYHVNWGWGGTSNGYFTLDMLGTSKKSAYNHYQIMAYHVEPMREASSPYALDFKADGIRYITDDGGLAVASPNYLPNGYSGDITIPSTVTHEGTTYPVTAIDEGAFWRCDNLTSITLPPTIQSIGRAAFFHNENLRTVTESEALTTVGDYAFYECGQLRTTPWGNQIQSIGDYSFTYTRINEITIPPTVRRIGSWAFCNCFNLSKIHITDLRDWCKITFEDEYSSPFINDVRLYLNGTLLTDVTIPEDVDTIPNYAFAFYFSLERLVIPNSVRVIGDWAFYYCYNLVDITLGENITSIGDQAFLITGGFDRLVLPKTVKSIGELAFYYNYNLTEVVDLGSVETIGISAFESCEELTTVNIPATVKSIGKDAFYGCFSLSRVNADDINAWCDIDFGNAEANPISKTHQLMIGDEEVTSLTTDINATQVGDFAFYGCEGLTNVTLGDTIQRIGNSAFNKCKNLTDFAVGNGAQTIGEMAFSACTSLTNIAMGSGMDSIAEKAFANCSAIRDITCMATTPPTLGDKNCFANTVYKKATLNVPKSALNRYSDGTTFWYLFKNMNGLGNDITGDVNGDGEVNLADINALIDVLLTDDTTASEDCDLNGDGVVNIADINTLIDLILSGPGE